MDKDAQFMREICCDVAFYSQLSRLRIEHLKESDGDDADGSTKLAVSDADVERLRTLAPRLDVLIREVTLDYFSATFGFLNASPQMTLSDRFKRFYAFRLGFARPTLESLKCVSL
jgi:hypothetical protein